MGIEQLVVMVGAFLAGAVLAGVGAYLLGRRAERRDAERAGRSAVQQAERLLADARRDADAARTETLLRTKEEILSLRESWEAEAKPRRDELDRHQQRLEERETLIDRKLNALDDQVREVERQRGEFTKRERALEQEAQELAHAKAERQRRLEQLAGLSAAEARQQLRDELIEAARGDAAAMVRDLREEAKRSAEREAKKIVAEAVQRIAAEHATETSVAAVSLPNDEMKGRIIGREGRNVRAFEMATGVDVIIDDTPDTVVVSCFDPIRREVARRGLEQLIADGRIHPGRIEEVVERVRAELERELAEAGEQAVYELGVKGMHGELVKLIGRMKYRTSYGQNLLAHSREVAWLAGMMASELKLDGTAAKRAALLHDIGKVLTHQHEGTHVELGVELARRYGENPVTINAIAAHHGDVPHESALSVLVQAADAISGARPGARREAFETYVKRLSQLEQIASSFKGVEKAYAIQAGREIRVAVVPDQVTDQQAAELSDQIARRIEGDLQYPGQIKVVVIRETRAVDVAR
jgi:ribonuclease Y